MKIIDHKLFTADGKQVKYHQTPNKSSGQNKLLYIVQHYTAGSSLEGAEKTLTDKNRKASAHFIIGRDGKIVQLGLCNEILWHVGTSLYKGELSTNKFSIGIENVNWGLLTKKNNKYYSYTGTEIPEEEIYKDSKGHYFHTYTHAQLETNFELCKALCKEYKTIKEIIGHSDCAMPRGRKVDPSEAFDMSECRKFAGL